MATLEALGQYCHLCSSENHSEFNCPVMSLKMWRKLESNVPQEVTDWHLNELSDYFEELAESHKLPARILNQHRNLVNKLTQIFQTVHPDVQVKMFGSCSNGFETKTSDLDVCVLFPTNSPMAECFTRGTCKAKIEHLRQLTGILHENKKFLNIWNIRPIYGARVKIVKFSMPNEVEVDLSFCNELAIYNTWLLREYNHYEPRLRILNVVVKEILKKCQLRTSSNGGISSYAYAIMLIHYLQQKGYLPCLQEAYESDAKPQLIVKDWNVWFQTDREIVSKMWKSPKGNTTVAKMWLGFLKYYLFEFDREAYSIRIDTKFLKSQVPPSKLLSIMDPFIETRNLAENADTVEMIKILTTFYNALLHHTTCVRNGMKVDRWIGSLFSVSKLGKELDPASFVKRRRTRTKKIAGDIVAKY